MRFIFGAGIEGTGHHAISLYVQSIAQSCGYEFKGRTHPVRKILFQGGSLTTSDKASMLSRVFDGAGRKHHNPQSPIVYYEDSSFPSGDRDRSPTTTSEIRKLVRNDLDSLYAVVNATGVQAKILYYTRDFATTISSHRDWDGGFRKHAQVMDIFRRAVLDIYQGFVTKNLGHLWRLVEYDWFYEDELLPGIVSAMVRFLEFYNCDIDKAVAGIKLSRNNKTVHEIDSIDKTFVAENFPLTQAQPPSLLLLA